MGLIFEIRFLSFFLALMGIVSAGFMWKNFRYAILLIFIVAAIVTPTPDIMRHVHLLPPHACAVRCQHWYRLARPSSAAAGAQRKTGGLSVIPREARDRVFCCGSTGRAGKNQDPSLRSG